MKKDSEQPLDGMYKGAPSGSFRKAKALRKKMTPAETRLWEELKNKKFNGLKFRRQHPIQLFIADFYCHHLKLVIELDGPYHFTENQKTKDEERDLIMRDLNLHIIRFTNEEVLNNMEKVLKNISDLIKKIEK